MAPIDIIKSKLPKKTQKTASGWQTLCPSHADRRPSLSLSVGSDGRVLLKCHAGCDTENILKAWNLDWQDVFPDDHPDKAVSSTPSTERLYTTDEMRSWPSTVALYEYLDVDGTPLFAVRRTPDKSFIQYRSVRPGVWQPGLGNTQTTLFHLPQLRKAIQDGRRIFLVEGEKDVLNLEQLGAIATCNPMGAGKWQSHLTAWLNGADVVILPDNDAPGREHAKKVLQHLHGRAAALRVVSLPNLREKGDVSDWIEAGGTLADLERLVETTSVWAPEILPLPLAPVNLQKSLTPSGPAWPDRPTAAFVGPAGALVHAIEPHSEADPVALLVQFLVAFGNIIGRTIHFRAEADGHYTNLFTVMVGETAKGRKGSSWGQVQRLLTTLDDKWSPRVLSGMSSGEGLIWHVRDPIERTKPVKQKGVTVDYETVVEDEGEMDKRLLAIEPEFASVLRNLERDGNTLSTTIRQAWDTGTLRTLVKNSPAAATGAHISVIGHITKDELRRYLDRTEVANGFANRFLWVCVKRSKLLPDGGHLDEVDWAPLLRQLSAALEFARAFGNAEMKRDDEARALWHTIYSKLSADQPGMLGAVTARAEAQVMRLACIYAVLDCSSVILKSHLEAAIAVWDYCNASCRYIFGDETGDPVADEILRALRSTPEGLTRTQLSDLFGRHQKAAHLARALSMLLTQGKVRCEVETTGGRPGERWYAATPTA